MSMELEAEGQKPLLLNEYERDEFCGSRSSCVG